MMRTMLIAVLFGTYVAAQATLYGDPDLPSTNPYGAVANVETIKSCSLVLPADNTLQGTNGVFNLRVYGLVNKLLWANIPVKWIIRTGKQHDGVDFTGSGWKLFPQNNTGSPPQSLQFSGGPWVIPVEYYQYALPIIQAYGSNVNVYKLSESTTADVRYTLDRKPYVAVLDSSGFNTIQVGYLESAGFENGVHFSIMSKEQANSFDSGICISMATEPHFEGLGSVELAESFVSAVRQFVNSGGNFLAECGGVRTYENCGSGFGDKLYSSQEPICPSGFFLTERGLSTHGMTTYTNMPVPKGKTQATFVVAPDAPLLQMSGPWVTSGGSVQNFAEFGSDPAIYKQYIASDSTLFVSPLRPGSYFGVKLGTTASGEFNETYVGMGGKTILGRRGGNVFYYAGHEYSTSSAPNGVRFYLNAALIPAERDQSCGFQVDQCAFGSCIFVKKRSATGEEVVEQVMDTSLTPCGCDVVYDCAGVCGGNVTTPGCAPPPRAPPPVRPPVAPLPPTAPAPKSAPMTASPAVFDSPSSGGGGSPSTGGNGSPSTSGNGGDGSNGAPAMAPSSIPGLPPSTIPINSGPKGGNTMIEQVDPNNPRTFVLVVGDDIRTIQVLVEVLNWNPEVKVNVYLAKGRIPTAEDSDCKWENINKVEFDYTDEVDNLAASRTSACSALDELSGEWVVVVESTQTTGFAFEGYIEPGYGVVKDLVVYLGSSSFTTPSFAVALIATVLAAICNIMY